MMKFLQYPALFLALAALCGCNGSSATLQPGEVLASGLADGRYIFDTKRLSHEHRGSVFYEEGAAEVRNEPGGRIRVTLLEGWGGTFVLAPRGGGKVVIEDARMNYGNMERSLKGEGMLLMGNQARGTCSIRLHGAIRVDRRKGSWTLRPAGGQ